MQSAPNGYGTWTEPPKRRRKVRRTMGCNCKKSKCLKLYCECFGKQSFCGPECNCVECQNVDLPQFEENRAMALSACFDRSATMFGAPAARKGCKCKRSQCAKNYCECFQAALCCLESCRCDDCGNVYGVKPTSLSVATDVLAAEEEKISPNTARNIKKQRLQARLDVLEKIQSDRIQQKQMQFAQQQQQQQQQQQFQQHSHHHQQHLQPPPHQQQLQYQQQQQQHSGSLSSPLSPLLPPLPPPLPSSPDKPLLLTTLEEVRARAAAESPRPFTRSAAAAALSPRGGPISSPKIGLLPILPARSG